MAKSKEELSNLLQNENVQWFLHNILKYESDSIDGKVNYGGFNQNAGNSSAFGAGQFIGSTRKEVLNAYGVDPWSEDFNEQLMATIAVLDMDGDLDNVVDGNFQKVFGVESLKKNKEGKMIGGSRWQAFYPEGHKDYVKNSKNLNLLGPRPEGWKDNYNTQLSTAVYDPEYSFNKIKKDSVKKGKINLFTGKYRDTIPDSLRTAIIPTSIVERKKDDVSPTPIQEPISLESSRTPPGVVTPEIIDPAEPVVPGLPTKDEWISNKVKKEQQEKTDLENNKKQVDETGNTIDDEIEEIEQEDEKLEVISEPVEEVVEEPVEEIVEEPIEEVIEEPVEEVIEEPVEEVVEEPVLIEPKRKDYKSPSDFIRARMDYFSKLEEKKEAETVGEPEEVFDAGTLPEITIEGGETSGDENKEIEIKEEEKETDLVVVNDRGEENIITIPNLIPSIQDNTGQHDHSLPFQPSPMQVAEGSFNMSLQREEGYGNPYTREDERLEGGFGKSSLSNEDLQKYFSLKTSKEKEEFLKVKEREQQEWEFQGGDTYATNVEYINDTEKLQSTNTINLLKEKYPNLDFSNVANKQDWIRLAMTPKNQGGLGRAIGGDSETEWNSIKNQFSTEGDDFNNTKLEIELANGVWDYVITDNVSGEKKDYGEDEELIKKEALNLIPRSDWHYYYNLEETELGQTAQAAKGRAGQRLANKESILQQARTKVFGKKLESLNSQGDQIVLDGDAFDEAYSSLENRINNFTEDKQSLQEEINILKDKYGTWKRDAAGALYYDQQDIMSDYDKDRLATINATMSDLEGERKLIVAKQAGLATEQTRINKQRSAWNEQFEDLTARYNWNMATQQFNPAFRATREYMKWNESIKNNHGKTADVISMFGEEAFRLWTLVKAINPATIKAAGIATLATLGLDKTASLWEDKVYQFAPHDINEYNSGYSHTGMLWDMLADVAGFDLIPTSQDESGKIIQHSKFSEDKKDYSWIGAELYDKIAPGWAGGKGNWSAYSTSKAFAQLLPYTVGIMQAYRGMGALSSKMRSTKGLWDGRSKMAKEWRVNKGIGKKIISALNKDFVASEKMLGRLNMIRINHKMTFFDNYADGRARGLDPADAHAYGNFLSLATGISQAIMPDYNWLKSTAGIKITKTLVQNLKSAKFKAVGKEISEIAAREANKAAFRTAGLNFLKEHLEEQTDVFLHDMVKSAYLANHSAEISDVNVQAEILSATTVLTVPLGSISAIRTRNNVRSRVYNVFKNQGLEVIRNGELEIKMLQNRINQTGNTKKDKILRDELVKEQTLLEENVEQARKIVRAINLSPKNVTDTQIDLLVRKQQLLERKSELNKKDKSLYSEEIEKINNDIKSIDVEIKENSIGNYENKLYKNLLKSAERLAPALGFTLKHNKVDEETFRIAIEKEKQDIASRNAYRRKRIENIRKGKGRAAGLTAIEKAKEIEKIEKRIEVDNLSFDSPGIIKYDHNGKGNHHIIINEGSAKWSGNTGVVLHELLHVMLKRTLDKNPQMLKGLAWMLKRELLKNPEKYKHSGYVVSLKGDRETGGKFDQYKFEKDVNNMAFDEMFTVFLEALAQGNISIKSNVLTKINDVFRRMFRANGINFNIKGHKGMINFLRDFQKEMENGRFRFNEKTGQEELSEGMMKIFEEGLPLDIDRSAVEAANQWEAKMIAEYNIDIWRPEEERVAKSIVGKTSRSNVYKTEKIKEDLQLTEGTQKIVEENERIRKLILEEGIKKDGKIVASEDLQTKLVENNLPLAISLGTFAAQNPKIMGLEEDKKITRDQFISGYYLELSKLAKTYDASVNEFGQYLNTILPIRYGNILEAEKKGAIQGARVEFDYVPDVPIDDDVSTPDDVDTRPKIDTAERLEVKDKTKPFIDKTLKQLKKLENLRVKLSEKQDKKAEEEIAKLTSDLESKGALDLDIESITVKQAPNLLYKTVAKIFGIDEDKLNPNSKSWLANLRKKEGKRGSNEVRSAQRAVAKHAQLILSTIFNEGHTAAFKSSGMPNTLLKFGYTKGSKRIGNNFPQYKKPNLSETDLLKFVGIEKVVKNGVTAFNFNVDRNTSAKLLAIAQMVDRNMSLQGINEYLEETGDLTPKIKNAIEDGMSKSSKSIYYIKSSKAIKEQIQDKLPELSYKLENVDEDWTQEEIEKVFEETFEDTDVKWKKFAKDMLAKTGILTRYVDRISRSKKFKTFEEFTKQELAQLEIYKGLFKILNLKVKNKADLYTKRNIKKARTRVAKLAKLVEDSYIKGDLSKKEAMELLFLLEQQHITAAKIGNGKWWALPGKNAFEDAYYSKDKKTKDGKKHPLAGKKIGESGTQRDQLFGSKEGAALDFRLFINNKLRGGKKGLQLGLDTKENNAIKKKLGITKLFAQKSKNVIESLIKDDFDFKGRKKEALLARKLVKMQINFYSKLYKDGEIAAEELAIHMLTFGSNMNTASRRAANVHGIQKGILSNITSGTYIYGLLKNIGKDLEYEHGKPHEQLILELISVGLTKKEKSLVGKDKPMPWESTEMDNVFVDYEVNIITKLMDKTLTASNRKSSMGFGYVKGLAQGWVQRMFNEENFGDPRVGAIVSLDGENTIYGEGHEKITKVLRKPVSEINKDKKISKGIQSARSINYSEKSKGITILDFDDTLAISKSEVISTAPDGTIRKLTAEEFAKEGADLLDQGWTHDFSEFSKVVDGKVASLFNKALKLQRKFGPENMFVLTARPADSAPAIFEFLKANGLNIPLKNITGLANSTPEAKALWVAEKVGEGYNDFYFADDALQNVQAVDNILSQFDVKRKVQQAKVKFSKGTLSTKQDLNWKTDSIGYMTTNFNIGDNNYKITFYPTDLNDTNYELEFDLVTEKGLTQEITGTGNQFKVLGIVYNGLLDVIKQNPNIEIIGFSSLTKDKSRARVYTILMDRLGKKLGWKTDIYKYGSGTQLDFEVAKPKTRKVRTKTTESIRNIPAVKNILNQSDIKSPTQQAKQSKSINYSERFNDILEETKGVDAEKRFSKAKAERRGEGKGEWQIFIPPSADDFIGLIYNFLGKGKKGEKQLEWFREVLLNPLNRAYRELYQAKQAIANDYKQLGKQLPNVRKKLFSKVKDSDFTYNDAIRVYLWEKSGFKIPGLSKTDIKELVSVVENDQDLKTYADTVGIISRSKEGYVSPTENWMVEDIRTDLIHATDTVNRKVFFKEFLENMEIIFSEENLNKIEAIYGKNFREALEDMLYRIEYGTNRSFGSNRLVNRFMNWINGSIGVTMFFNSRSAILQTLSTVNFINWDDNNPIAAAKAFANQKQYWADFVFIFNSDMLKQRRAGKSFDLNSNELANYVSNSKQPVRSAINWLLQKGFLPTQIMDSFAIAAGGATFYRNRLNTYLLQGDPIDVAKQKAFADFQGIAEQTQQSARQDMISQQQASVLGRLILAFQNTPMQYARLMKKAILDLKNGRGDTKSNISRIVYYGAIQNLIFYSMQTALFAMMFGDDDDDDEKWLEKKERVINGGLDSLLRGMGVGGAAVSTLKNMIFKFIKEQEKPRNRRDESAILMELLNLSPPIGIKARQIQSGTKTINWNGDTISQMPLYDLNNPVWEAGFNYTQALTNVPLARLHTKVSNIRESLNKENEAWQRIAMFSGWSKWNIGIRDKKRKSKTKKRRSYGRKVKSY